MTDKRDMTKDVEENAELYTAFADSGEGNDKTGEIKDAIGEDEVLGGETDSDDDTILTLDDGPSIVVDEDADGIEDNSEE